MKKLVVLGILAFLCVKGLCSRNKTFVDVKVDSRMGNLSKENQEHIWLSYLKINETDWIQFNLSFTDSSGSDAFYMRRHFCQLLCAYLQGEGLQTRNVRIEYGVVPHVVVYKPKGKMKYANFIYDDPRKKQTFMVSNAEGATCETAAGNRIKFAPGAFKADGDTVKVELWEYTSVNDFVTSGYTSTSKDRLISSSGMYNIKASCNGAKAELHDNAASINFPTKNFTDTNDVGSFQTFYGNEKDEVIDWKPSYDNLSDARNPEAGTSRRKKRKRIVKVTELYYVSICYNLPILESRYSTLDRSAKEDFMSAMEGKSISPRCDYNQADYTFITSKYKLQKRKKKMDMEPISSYAEFAKLMASNRSDVFLLLTPEQNKRLLAAKKGYKAKQKKKQEELKEMFENPDKVAAAQKEIEQKRFPIEMKISQLGRINCDRFYDTPQKTNIIVKLDQFDFEQIRVYAVFNDIKSVIPAQYHAGNKNGYVQFNDLPVDRDVLYVAATFKGDEVKLAYVDKKIKKDDVVPLALTTYSKSRYEAIMNDIIPN